MKTYKVHRAIVDQLEVVLRLVTGLEFVGVEEELIELEIRLRSRVAGWIPVAGRVAVALLVTRLEARGAATDALAAELLLAKHPAELRVVHKHRCMGRPEDIPPDSPLIFLVQVMKIEPAPASGD